MSELVKAFLLVYAALFPIVNPIGAAPLFLSATQDCTDRERHGLAGQVGVNSFFMLLGSLFVGAAVLEFFGITVPVVRIAGGLVVSVFGWRLLQSGGHLENRSAAAHEADRPDGFYPLTMPLTVGPGSISVAVTLGSQRPQGLSTLAGLELPTLGAVAGLAAIAITVYFCYRFATNLVGLLGERGTRVLIQLSAFVMLCIGIQIVWNGLSQLLRL